MGKHTSLGWFGFFEEVFYRSWLQLSHVCQTFPMQPQDNASARLLEKMTTHSWDVVLHIPTTTSLKTAWWQLSLNLISQLGFFVSCMYITSVYWMYLRIVRSCQREYNRRGIGPKHTWFVVVYETTYTTLKRTWWFYSSWKIWLHMLCGLQLE